jgi:RHS repeat-associated protein
MTVPRGGYALGGATTHYALDVAGGLPQVIAEATGGATTQYLQVQSQILAQYDSGTWGYVAPDALGSVRQLTDADSQVTLAQSYDPFGNVLEVAGSTESGFGYTGEQADASMGLIFLRARYYDPSVGRFLTKDPNPGNVYRPQSLNPYIYVLNNSINDRDPSGEQGEYIDEFLQGVVYQFIDNNYDALGVSEQSKSLLRRGADEVAATHNNSLAFQLGRLTGSAVTIGQAFVEIEGGGTIMGCGAGGGALTWETGVGAVAGGGAVVVGAAVTAHGVVVGVVSAANAGEIAGNIYWMAAEGGQGGPRPQSQGPGQWGPRRGTGGADYERQVREHLEGPSDQNYYYNDTAYDAWDPNTSTLVDAKDAQGTWFTDRLDPRLSSIRDRQILEEARRQVEKAGSYHVAWWTNNAEAVDYLRSLFNREGIPIKVERWP